MQDQDRIWDFNANNEAKDLSSKAKEDKGTLYKYVLNFKT